MFLLAHCQVFLIRLGTNYSNHDAIVKVLQFFGKCTLFSVNSSLSYVASSSTATAGSIFKNMLIRRGDVAIILGFRNAYLPIIVFNLSCVAVAVR